MGYLMDFKRQLYFLTEIKVGQYNSIRYNGLGVEEQRLYRQSIDQDMLVGIRILWEKFMNFFYLLETGEELEDKTSKSRSKSKVFQEFVKSNVVRYKFLDKIIEKMKQDNDGGRTAEVHKKSCFRKELNVEEIAENSQYVLLINFFINDLYYKTEDIICGRQLA